MVRSPWALACSALLMSCFTGADAQGLPCDNDRQCGLDQSCVAGFCGGASAGTASSSGSESNGASSSFGTMLGSSSSGSGSADTTVAGSSGSEASSSGSGSTGNEPLCAPPPELDRCTLGEPILARDSFSSVIVQSDDTPMLARPSSVVTGYFDDDATPDLAVQDFFTFGLHVFTNDDVQGWTQFGDVPTFSGETYDLVHADLDCDGDTEFMLVTQANQLLIRSFTGSGFEQEQTVPGNLYNFSLAVGDLVEDPEHYPDVVTAQGNVMPGVLLLHNEGGELAAAATTFSMIDEPWDTVIVQTDDGPLVVVPQGRNYQDDQAIDRVAVFRPVMDEGDAVFIEPAALELPADFDAPWAVASGNFLGDARLELAIGERHVDDIEENTDSIGTVRFFTYLGLGGGDAWMEVGSVQTRVGLVSLATADLDCDGYDDLFVGHNGTSTTMNDDGMALALFGAPALDAIEDVELDGEGPISAGSRMAVADFDLDGAVEVAVADFGSTAPGARVVIFGLDP